MSASQRRYDAYNAGRQHYEQGGDVYDNPYDDSKARLQEAWRDGYSEAALSSMHAGAQEFNQQDY